MCAFTPTCADASLQNEAQISASRILCDGTFISGKLTVQKPPDWANKFMNEMSVLFSRSFSTFAYYIHIFVYIYGLQIRLYLSPSPVLIICGAQCPARMCKTTSFRPRTLPCRATSIQGGCTYLTTCSKPNNTCMCHGHTPWVCTRS